MTAKYDPDATSYPCQMHFTNGTCPGDAQLNRDHYQCDACGASWGPDGEPWLQGVQS